MRNRTKIVFIITAVLLVLALAACDMLVAPIKERLNPNDSQNPVPAVENLELSLSYDNDIRNVSVTWTEGSSQVDNELEGYIIVRKAGSVPENIWSGDFVAMLYKEDTPECFDNTTENSEYPVGYTVYYSVFSFGPKWNDMNEEDKIGVDGDGNLFNTANYQFTGPVSASIDIWAYVDMSVDYDGYMDGGSIWFHTDNSLIVETSTSTPNTIAGIVFNLDNIPSQEVLYAGLILTKNGASSNGDGVMEIARWDDLTWQSENMFTNLTAQMTSDNFTVSVPSGDGDVLWADLTDIYGMWADGTTNAGISLRSYDGDNSFPFCASEEGTNGPKLRLFFMY